MFDVELGFGGDVDAFAGDLDFEVLTALEDVGQASEFFDELRKWIIFLDVALWFAHREERSDVIRPRIFRNYGTE